MKFCSTCGAEINEGAAVCTKCGCAVQSSAAPVGQLKTNKSLAKYIFLSIITLGIYGLVVMSSVSNDINIAASRYDGKKTMHYLNITCVFFKIFGIPCPGCGMTRAFLSLLKLDFYSAAKYNILIFFMPYVFMYVFFDFKHKIHNKIMIGIALFAIINWVLKLTMYF